MCDPGAWRILTPVLYFLRHFRTGLSDEDTCQIWKSMVLNKKIFKVSKPMQNLGNPSGPGLIPVYNISL